MHLGGRAEMSTLRRTLAAALAPVLDLAGEDDTVLSAWIARHMAVVTLPIQDADTLADFESAILQRLDTPFNLGGLPQTSLRDELRRRRRNRE